MITIEQEAFEIISADALHSFPDECCGFLFGYEEDDQRIVREALVVNNAKEGDKKRRFEITAADYMKAERYALQNGVLLLGVYHSHPLHPAIPSETDRLSAQPWFSYVIVSVTANSIENTLSWRLNEERIFEPEPLLVPQITKQ